MPKKVLVALPPGMLMKIDDIAGIEHRTRSDLIREALRRYMDNFEQKKASLKQKPETTSLSKDGWEHR
jgi:metal-responsive CopG/Arc/MetJ family transcriptional regulator